MDELVRRDVRHGITTRSERVVWLMGQLRLGRLSRARVDLASYLGDPAARDLVAVTGPGEIEAWAVGLVRWDHDVVIRCAIASLQQALGPWERDHPCPFCADDEIESEDRLEALGRWEALPVQETGPDWVQHRDRDEHVWCMECADTQVHDLGPREQLVRARLQTLVADPTAAPGVLDRAAILTQDDLTVLPPPDSLPYPFHALGELIWGRECGGRVNTAAAAIAISTRLGGMQRKYVLSPYLVKAAVRDALVPWCLGERDPFEEVK